MTDTDIQRELQLLRRAYCRKLPGELARLGALLARAREASDEQQLDAAHRLAHMLMGSSGSLRLTEVSAEMRRIEESLERVVESGPEISEGVWEEIEEALSAARGRFDAPGRE